ncbi:hypothetical protein [Brachymonas denitrificans]|uniref:Membrane-bound lysozyme-inhibitor of c-type lysozyme n=1 Tax=Brachymonas denitrificans DSM 15123 TaxID=1121117 RepID=A0A1H8EEP2_9BURK|nr:hypothetical protein [Brachymonas denitrificans]SEN17866.1 hypothetical protein SAMN02745977_00659 [Brachymonas denitrificans DSM 15123]
MKKTLIALSAMMIAASGAMAATTPAKAPAKKAAAAKKAAPKKAVKKPAAKKAAPAKKAPSKLRERLAVNPITGASAPVANIPGPGTPFPAPAAGTVFTGTMRCELGSAVTVTQDAARPTMYQVSNGKGLTYTMHQVPTTTGVVRLEDRANGATWLQLGNKSMLMDQKRGERVADGCQNPQQVARDRELQQRPVDLLR